MAGRYMGNMYTLDAFNTSNPADQDILSHYKMQQVDRPITMIFLLILITKNSVTVHRLSLPQMPGVMFICQQSNFSGHEDVEERGTGDSNLHKLCPWVKLVP